MEIPHDIISLLEEEAQRINSKDFIAEDPVQFPRRFDLQQDVEIVAFLSAIIAWGKRKMICRDAEKMIQMMDYQPYSFLMEEAYNEIPDRMNIHRTFFGEHLKYFLRGMREVYARYSSLDEFCMANGVGKTEAPSWRMASLLGQLFSDVNDGKKCSQCIPTNLDTTALKRINMALRWLVRDDGIVDMGIWKSIPKSKLFIPLDVHVGNVARQLGLLTRKSNDRKAVEQLTEAMRQIRPDDPAIMDYALFGIGVSGAQIPELIPD